MKGLPTEDRVSYPLLSHTNWLRNSIDNVSAGTSLESYFSAIIDAGFSRIPRTDGTTRRLPFRGSVEEHRRLLDMSKSILQKFSESPMIQKLADHTMLHWDFNTMNMNVSEVVPTRITSIYDWQFTSIEPAIMYADMSPDFLDHPYSRLKTVKRIYSRTKEDGTVKEPEGFPRDDEPDIVKGRQGRFNMQANV